MRVFQCKFISLCDYAGCDVIELPRLSSVRAKVLMHEDHDKWGGRMNEVTVTSAIRSIDFERKLIVTRNNIYDFND